MTVKGPTQFIEVNGVMIPTEQYVANKAQLDANRKVDLKAEPKLHIGIKSIQEQVRLGLPTEPIYLRPGEDPVEAVRRIHKAMNEPKQEAEVVEDVEETIVEEEVTEVEAEEVAPVKKKATTFGKKK